MTKRFVDNLLHKDLSYAVHGAAIEVRKDFGPGHKEKLYQEAFAKELKRRGLQFEKKKAIKIYAPKNGEYIGLYRPDFIVEEKIIIETKAERFVNRDEVKRVYDYLRNSEYELAYLINFASPQLFIRRVIFTNDRKPFYGPPKDTNTKPSNTNKFLVSIGFILVLISGLRIADAAAQSIYFDGPAEVAVGQEFEVQILLDTDQPVNAYAVSATYPRDALSVVGVSQNDSIIDVWQDQPVASGSGAIEIKGGSVSPFKGEKGELLSVRLKALRPGIFEFRFGNSFLYLANGKGTKVSVVAKPLRLRVGEGHPAETLDGTVLDHEAPAMDTTPPEVELTALTPDPLNPAQKFFGFIARDSESGVRSVSYRAKAWFFWDDAHPAMNPIAVSRSVWAVSITAVDYAGNSEERLLYDWTAFAKGPVLVLGIVSAFAIFLTFRIKRRSMVT
ncbi:MAG: hypothetical protein A2945_03305 [Candidatus Liptonbacteria bacterium RIFCSPLOWO2_01_FULL_52_25]|uniref:GxxExxY protein n=1 Tax=Candidatus Liptonbacteria bacterium RIFCSPLOWO2_01_FULL_52_25 TaxID=1798650 RepID=A0A1G2CEJ2_9BACT|nr:MAG: hypothetical protein A2945_03305 [Candidatus Liptonbacteria bacterium RIFCSPLOWO2_01_FULL_52_25]